MATLNDYFRTEAHEFLTAVERGLERKPAPDSAELQRAVRGLRGTAQMAREQRVFDVVSAFESVTRSFAAGALAWSDEVTQRARATLDDVRTLLEGAAPDDQLDGVVDRATARWRDAGAPAPPAPEAPAPAAHDGTREFREFAAREAAGIADVLDRGVQQLQEDPMDREPLKAILRRQRALLGAARLEEIPIIAEILRAVEDLTRVIAKLDIGVKREWLDIYRVARDGLQSTIAPLLRNERPETTHAVSRLRHMHEELLERYGGDAAAETQGNGFMDPAPTPQPVMPFVARAHAASPTAAPAPMPPLTAPPPPAMASAPTAQTAPLAIAEDDTGDVLELDESTIVTAADGPDSEAESAADIIEIDTLSYSREDALRRALELHETLARGAAHDPRLRDAVEELFDLIRIALG